MSLCSLIGQHWMDWWFTGYWFCKLVQVAAGSQVSQSCVAVLFDKLLGRHRSRSWSLNRSRKRLQQDVSSKLAVGNKLGAETKQTSASKTKTVHTWRLTHEAGSDFSCEDGSRTERIKLSFDFTSSGVTRLFLLDPAVQRTNRHNFLKTNFTDPIAFFQPKF